MSQTLEEIFFIMVSKQKQKRKQIYEIYLANKSWAKPLTLKQFKQVFITKIFSYRILLRAKNDSAHKKVPISGRVAIAIVQKPSIPSKLGFTTLIRFRSENTKLASLYNKKNLIIFIQLKTDKESIHRYALSLTLVPPSTGR
jgi:hypothetical protein